MERRIAIGLIPILLGVAAGAAEEDVILLESGEEVRGCIVSSRPGRPLVIQEERTGELVAIEAGRVRVVRAATCIGKVPSAPKQLLAAEGEPFTLTVHIDSGGTPVGLWRRRPVQDELVCTAPCDRPIEMHGDDVYYFGGDGVTRSNPFPFIPRNGEVTLKVAPGRMAWFGAGIAGMVLGGAASIGGFTLALSNSCPFCSNNPSNLFYDNRTPHQKQLEATGWTVCFLGAVAVAGSAALALSNNHTDWSVAQPRALRERGATPEYAWLRPYPIFDPRQAVFGVGGSF